MRLSVLPLGSYVAGQLKYYDHLHLWFIRFVEAASNDLLKSSNFAVPEFEDTMSATRLS